MPTQAPSADLWDRLRAFRSDLQPHPALSRVAATDPKFWGAERVREVILHAARVPGANIWDTVRARHPTLPEAIRLAVEQAEAKGWAAPRLTLKAD